MKQWYVVKSKPHKESAAVENLERQGYTTYCPQITHAKRTRGRWRAVAEPLFPRYLFVQLNVGEDDFAPIRSTIGISSLVRFGNVPANIPQQVITAIQNQEQQLERQVVNHPNWKPGDEVEIIEGPFAGLKGVFEKKNGEERVIVLLNLLGRNNNVAVAINAVVPV